MTLSNSLTNKESALEELVADIKRGYFAIPSFQRGVVWKTPDVRKLGDSLLWGYPVSSLLLMPVSSMLDIKNSPLAVEGLPDMNVSKGSFVLDGQQRLTALAKLFVEHSSENIYYYDLLHILVVGYEMGNKDDPEFQAGGIFEKGLEETIRRHKNVDMLDDYACKSFKRTKSVEGHETMRDHRFIRCDVVLNSGFGKYINKFLDHHLPVSLFNNASQREQTVDKFIDYLTGLLGTLKRYGIPVTLINDGSDLNLVCSVFERVNSSGIKLTTFDLVNAKSYGYTKHEGGFASYVSSEFNKKDEIDKNTIESINKFFEYTKSGYSDLARLIRILFIGSKISTNSANIDLTNGLLLEQHKDFWFTEFEKQKKTLCKVINWSERNGLSSVAPKSFVEYMASIFIGVENLFEVTEFKNAVIKYGLSLSVHGQSFNKSHYRVFNEFIKYARDLVKATEWERMQLSMPHYFNSSAITADNILSTKYSGKGFKYTAMLAVMYDKKHNGLFGHDLCGESIDFGHRYDPAANDAKGKFEEHHLIPKMSIGQGSLPAIDSLANIALLTKNKNVAINNMSIEDYLRKLESNIGPARFKELMLENLIPFDMINNLDATTYAKFLHTRAVLIAQYLNDYFKFDTIRDEFEQNTIEDE